METWEWIVLGVACGLALLLAIAFARIRQRRSHLKSRFGPEYGRVVADQGIGTAESHLNTVESEHDKLHLRELPPVARDRYLEEWRQAETRFVSDPRDAVRGAERLVDRVLRERGYPEDGDRRELVSFLAIDHPDAADRYRHGHAMLESVDGAETTEKLRKAMLDFRSVFEDALRQPQPTALEVVSSES